MLTDTAIRSLKPADRPRKVFDERGLFLLVTPTGSRLWRFKYRIFGIEKTLSLGAYPDVPLQSARARRDKARQLLADGIDPSAHRKAEKAKRACSFKEVALAWLERQRKSFSQATIEKTQWMFDSYLFPALGSRPIVTITAPELLQMLLKVEARGLNETAHRLRQRLGQIFRYAVVTNLREHDPTPALHGALAPVVTKHHAAITDPKEIGGLLRAIDSYTGQVTTCIALKLAPYVFARPIELRAALWSEFQLEGGRPEWRIPAERMKMKEEHIVPLSRQAAALLRELRRWTSHSVYAFPALANNRRPMSENTINAALRRLGYSKDEMTGHGFRSLASTLMNELGWPPDLIELQLSHTEPNKVRAAYNGAKRLEDRRRMMQAWADHLEELKCQTPRSENGQSFDGDLIDSGPAYFQ